MIALLLAALPAGAARAQTEGVRRVDGGVAVDFQGTDLRLVVAALAEAGGLNVMYGDLPQAGVNLRAGPVPVGQVRVLLEQTLDMHQLKLQEESPGLFRIVSTAPAPQPVQAQAPPYPGAGAIGQGGPVQVYVHRLRHAPAEDVARSIGALFGIGEGAWGGNDRPQSLTNQLRGQTYNPGDPVPPQQPQAGPRGLTATLAGQVQIFPDPRTNSLLIRASAGDYATIAQAVQQLDTRPLQVLIEVLIAEVRRDRQFSLGVDYRIPDQSVNGSETTIGGELVGGSAGDAVLRIMKVGEVNMNIVLRALAASGDVTVLSRPVVLAQNNEEARIMVGDQRPFIQISRALPTDGATRDQVIQYRDVGTQLTIRPTINPDGYVTLTVLQEVSTATDVTQFGAPVISTREAETRLLVKDGHTVVIGGLIDHQRTSTASGIPILRDIPLLGYLFRSTTRRNTSSELFLFLVPHVLYSDADVDSATSVIRQNSPRLDRALPDSVPLYWNLRTDTTGAPRGQAPPRPQAQPAPRPRDEEDGTGDVAMRPAAPMLGSGNRGDRRGRRGRR
ncbi:MAG TPA: secretin N-terminal domain-containing protein, partial [Longimicrobium sp.]|nr:secretin N-terminal domain-containing protein [Longimicrobium sp.]